MREIDFSIWLQHRSTPKKLVSDYISRLKRIEHSIKNCDIDEEYSKDNCGYLLSLFKNIGRNDEMEKAHIGNLPIGKYYLSAYKYALKKYIEFKNSDFIR